MGREDYWLQLQIRRAAFSVPCNIVEGYSRRSRKEYLQFLNVAKASLAEVEYQLFFMAEEGIADGQSLPQIDCLRSDTPALLHNLMKSLEKGPDRDGRFVREIGSEYLLRNEASPDPTTPDP
jgi:four helix bundle protein